MFPWSRQLIILLSALGLIALSACATGTPNRGSDGGKLEIVVAFYPYQFVAERIAGDTAEVQNLTTPGAEPHDLELTARQVAAVTDADLVIYEKTFQAAVDEAVAQSGQDNTLDTATVVPLLAGSAGKQADEHGADSGLDPHTWLDPTNMAKVATAVADRLSAVAPQNEATYRANATTLTAELATLDQSFVTGLKTCRRTEFITTHAAFGYLARRYGLEQVGISGLSPDAEPSPARIAEVQKVAREHGVTTIFYETLISPAVAKSIADDLGLDTDVLDPLEGITDQSRGTDYLLVMTANLAALRQANACS